MSVFNNSVYSVTPPSLYLNDNGPSILLLGFNEEEIKRINLLFNKHFPDNSITYFYDDVHLNINEVTAPWARATGGMVDFALINTDTCNELEVFISTQIENDSAESPTVVYISEQAINKTLNKLLLSYSKKLFAKIEDVGFILDIDD